MRRSTWGRYALLALLAAAPGARAELQLGTPDQPGFHIDRIVFQANGSGVFCPLAQPGAALVRVAATGPLVSVSDDSQRLRRLVGEHHGYLSAGAFARLLKETNSTPDELLLRLIPIAKEVSRPDVSNYPVGAVGLGESGAAYFGGNISFIGVPNAQSVHAEQAVIVNAKLHGETSLSTLAVSDEPCGMCRQFLNALSHGDRLRVIVPSQTPITLAELLPRAFGAPKAGGILIEGSSALLVRAGEAAEDGVAATAVRAARTANSRYNPAGVALKLSDGRIYSGGYIEISGGNPSLPPLQAALVGLALDGVPYSAVREAVLAELSVEESRVIQEAATRDLLAHIAPQARFSVVRLERQK